MSRSLLHFEPGDGSGPLSRLLVDESLRGVFQPIVSMGDGSIYAHEALIRGPANLPLHSPDLLLAAARRENLLIEFEIACVRQQLSQWAEAGAPGRLFLNLSASTLVQVFERFDAAQIAEALADLGLRPGLLVVEITEHEHVTDVARLRDSVQKLHAAGLALALDDFGDGRSSLRLWSELAPDIVKIDKYFTRELSRHGKKVQTLRALLQIADTFGTTLVAEGIETGEDLRLVRDLGISLAQGYLLGRPNAAPLRELAAEPARIIRDRRIAVMPQQRTASSPARLRELHVVDVEPITRETSNDRVAALFHANPQWHAIAIVDGATPVGLVNRQTFMDRYSKQFFKELYGRKPCVAFANMTPRLVERDQSLAELTAILTSQDQRYLSEGFIVTERGRYVGLGTSEQLVRNVTESRIEAARHANPLTFLPGNIPISEHIGRLLASGADFVACYTDLSDFKPFNDLYGYWQGDEVIKLAATVIVRHCDAAADFVGHVGGDDFVVLFQSADWRQRCDRMVAEFAERVPSLYDEAARAARGISAEDRHGIERFFPFTALYVGAVRAGDAPFVSAEQVAGAAARAKQAAKRGGLSVVLRPPQAGDSMFAALSGG
ncbi:MAG TPA: EAL domain-containing protein [Burkholderiaceae bacterium]|nr:EAL domain-containing protein [Burkholderiaceae bacterium]